MRTESLLREYLRDPAYVTPSNGWERLVWHAADLIRLAHVMRNTNRASVPRVRRGGFVQEELFNTERR